jgi:hypothetical protein
VIDETDYRRSGNEHFFNLEFDPAIADFLKLVEQNPADPISYNYLASAELYKELYRLGLLDCRALNQDVRTLAAKAAPADPNATGRFLETLGRGRRTAEQRVAQDHRDEGALYALCTNYGLQATYDFLIDKSWFSALHSGSKARGYCDQVRKVDPLFIDAYLVLGTFDYTAGSLPLPVRLLAAIGGLHGSKERGIEYVTRVAQQGKYARESARVLLTVLYHREKQPLIAAHILEGLMADYPRNYMFGLELAFMYSEAGQLERAVTVLKMLLQKADENAAGYLQLPRETVRRAIQALEERQLAGHRTDAARAWP